MRANWAQAYPGLRLNFVFFLSLFSSLLFYGLFMILGSLFGSMFDVFLYLLHHFHEYICCIDLSSIVGWISVLFLMLFWYVFRSRTQPAKPYKTLVFIMNFNDFTIQRNMFFWWCPWYFSLPVLTFILNESTYQFWIHFGSPLA